MSSSRPRRLRRCAAACLAVFPISLAAVVFAPDPVAAQAVRWSPYVMLAGLVGALGLAWRSHVLEGSPAAAPARERRRRVRPVLIVLWGRTGGRAVHVVARTVAGRSTEPTSVAAGPRPRELGYVPYAVLAAAKAAPMPAPAERERAEVRS